MRPRTRGKDASDCWRRFANTRVRADALDGVGGVASLQGDYVLALALWEECLAIRRELGDAKGSAIALLSLAMVAKDLGDPTAARALYAECMEIQDALGDP